MKSPSTNLILALLTWQLVACSLLGRKKDPPLVQGDFTAKKAQPAAVEEGEEEAEQQGQLSTRVASLELKQAQMAAHIEDLEEQLLRQKERTSLLEKGLLLGLPPVSAEPPKSPAAQQASPAADHVPSPPAQVQTQVTPLPPPPEPAAYAKGVEHAKKLFHEGRYSQAYLDFSKLERQFDSSIHGGEPQYWIGRCWLELKEFSNALQSLTAFIEQYPSSPQLAAAKFYLAKVELARGFQENALKHLQALIKQHPYEGVAEAAKQLIQNLAQGL